MAIIIKINGNASGEGFLIAPDGTRTFAVPVGLRTDDGTTVAAVLQQAMGGASLVFSATNVNITPTETFVDVHATSASGGHNDTVLQVAVGGVVQASFNLTSIQNPEIWFQGRFQARFATNNDFYNEQRGTISGWNFALIGEPDFCPPAPASIIDVVDKAGVGRVIRFHNPVTLRSHVAPIGVSVVAIQATVGGSVEAWTAGDPVIGQSTDLGPDTYFAGNFPAPAAPAEQFGDAFEPLGQFQFHISNWFSGKPAVPGDRPIANGLPGLSVQEKAQYGVSTLATFKTNRKNALIAEYNGLSAADQAGTPGSNIKTRIGRLGGGHVGPAAPGGEDVPSANATQVSNAGLGWTAKEEYNGLVNSAIQFGPNNSTVLAYMAAYNGFTFFAKFLNYHADEQCGQVHGNLIADPSSGIPALQTGVYNSQKRQAAPFNALNVNQMTTSAVDAVLAAGSMAQKLVVSVSGAFNRLVVSEAVIANPADPPASWTITSRGASLVGRLLPQASVFPRDFFYLILPPGDQGNVLGACEGILSAVAPAVGFARLFYDAGATAWRLLVHAGTPAGMGITYNGTWAGAAATNPTGCVAPDVEVLTPTVDFGNVEQGMVMYREILLLNRSGAPVTITLPALVAPFGQPPGASNNVVIPAGEIGALLVSYTAGAAGPADTQLITLTANPLVTGSLDITLTGTPVAPTTADMVLVLDRSFSMSEPALTGFRSITKAQLRNEAAQMLVDLLRDGDRIGMVRFNQDAQDHMLLEVAGAPVVGTGRVDAATALGSADLNPAGSTSVGDGMDHANTLLVPPSSATSKSMVVLTDGVENQSLFISDVVLAAGIHSYAIGLGLPENVNVDKLSAVTGNTGGYLLVTGELDSQNEFRLHKYFAQILAGITADSIIVDPQLSITPGDTQRTPFYITEADTEFDAVLLTRFPVLRFTLEAPDGTRIDPSNAGTFNGAFVQGRACRYYRMKFPTFAGSFDRNFGKWHMVVTYPGLRRLGPLAVQRRDESRVGDDRKTKATIGNVRRTYNLLARAHSSIQMNASIEQKGFGPGADRTLVAYLRGFGLPLHKNINLFAQITRPDRVATLLPLTHAGNGRFQAKLDDTKLFGTYQIVVRAAGKTPGNWPLQREQTLTGIVIDPTAKSEDQLQIQELRDLIAGEEKVLKDILKNQDERLRELEKLLERIVHQLGSAAARLPAGIFWALIVLILLLIIIILLLLR